MKEGNVKMGFELTGVNSLSIDGCDWNIDSIKDVEIIDDFVPSTLEEDAIKYLNDISSAEFTLECENSWIAEDLLKQFTAPLPEPYTIEYTKYIQARKHKKRRINKKWLKRYGIKPIQVRTEGWELHTHTDGSFEFVKPMGD